MATTDEAKLNVLVDSIYDHCRGICQLPGNEHITFSQRDLLETDLIPGNDSIMLGRVIQGLMDRFLFAARQDDHGYPVWGVRSREDALEYALIAVRSTIPNNRPG